MLNEQLLNNGITLFIVSVLGLIVMRKLVMDDTESIKKEGAKAGSFYGRTMRKFLYTPLFILFSLIGLCLTYNGLALRYDWPLIFKFWFS